MKNNPVDQFVEKISASVEENTFARLMLSRPTRTNLPEKMLVRLIDLKGTLHFSIVSRFATRDVTKNFPISEGIQFLREKLGGEFQNALLGTSTKDWQLYISSKQEARLVAHKASAKELPERSHDKMSGALLDRSAADWLHALGVTDASGKVLVSMADKHRQITHYVEILSHLAKDCGWVSPNPTLPRGELVLADMGCGKGYLTFAAWHLFRRIEKLPMKILGVETREDLVKTTNSIAKRIGASELEFVSGTIASAKLPQLDALIALHACNTATDEAILRGIELNAKLIVVAPCCHKELRLQLGKSEPFAAVLQHGIMEERMAEWVTDGLRALYLEWAGYRTKVFEFIASEHTPKNLMIAAIREREPFTSDVAKERMEKLKEFFGIRNWMGKAQE